MKGRITTSRLPSTLSHEARFAPILTALASYMPMKLTVAGSARSLSARCSQTRTQNDSRRTIDD